MGTLIHKETLIPKELENKEFKFIKLQKNSKEPVKNLKWGENLFNYDNDELINHFQQEGNYGVVAGYGNLRIIDIDDKKLGKKLLNKIDTLTVQTCGGNYHFFIYSDYDKNHIFKKSQGEMRSKNYYVVGPNCYAEDPKKKHKGYYKIIKNLPIKTLNKDDLLKIIDPFLIESETKKEQIIVDKEWVEKNVLPTLNENIRDLIKNKFSKTALNALGFNSRSERDQRVIINLLLKGWGRYIKSIFENFPIGDKYYEHTNGEQYLKRSIEVGRKYSGVKDDSVISLEKEIEDMSDRLLRNKLDEFLSKILNIKNWVLQQYFIGNLALKTKINKTTLSTRLKEIKKEADYSPPKDIMELFDKDIPETEYWMEPIIPKNNLILIGGKAGSFKSMFTLSMLLSLKNGNTFLDKFTSKEDSNVLLYDLENNTDLLARRIQYLKKGLNLDKNNHSKKFRFKDNFQRDDMDKELEEAKDYDIVILDSYRRFLKDSENESDVTNDFYNNFLMPLKKQNKTIIIIHHFKKGNILDLSSDDELMDLFRGSSDIVAQFDLIYGIVSSDITTQDSKTIFNVGFLPVKNREGLPINSFTFQVKKDDTELATTLKYLGEKRIITPKERFKNNIIKYISNFDEIHVSDIIKYANKYLPKLDDDTIRKYIKELKNNEILIQPKYGYYKIPDKTEKKVSL